MNFYWQKLVKERIKMNKEYLLLIIFLFWSCTSSNTNNKSTIEKRQYTEERNPVEVIILKNATFKKEMVSSGKLIAPRKSNLKFRTNGIIEKLFVKNGQTVSKGDTIATLDDFEQKQRREQAKLRLEKAYIDLQDALISMGYNLNDSLNVPENFMQIAKSRSGYSSAQNELKSAQFELKATTLITPFSGKIANLQTKEYENTPGDAFCLLIDDNNFEVRFPVLETEIANISLDKTVKVTPFSSERMYHGFVNEINPVVNENGLIDVKAIVNNTDGLIEGMNVKILIENNIKNQLIVPKGAVLQRDNQQVLFKYTNGIAWWTYVQTNYENSTSYAVIAHPDKGGALEAGDTVIVSGNLNLAHESVVEIE